jgi:hypothetical protein
MECWFFDMVNEDIHIIAQAAVGDSIGDGFHVVHPGEEFYHVSYCDLKAAAAGMVIVEHDGRGRIE